MIRNEAPDYGHRYNEEEYAVTWEQIGGMDVREVLIPRMLKPAGICQWYLRKMGPGSSEALPAHFAGLR